MNKKICKFALLSVFTGCLSLAVAEDQEVGTKDQKMAVFLINGKSAKMEANGTGFACTYKNREFVATNLHVIEGATVITARPQSGNNIALSGAIIVAEDADICLLAIKGSFGDIGITPLELMEDVFKGAKAGDKIICLGNSLGNGVISATTGTIKAFGQPRLEIDSPVVQGNSGGPIIHQQTGKVVGLVTEAQVNEEKANPYVLAAKKSKDSTLTEISYFGHRVDAVQKWKATTLADYEKAGRELDGVEEGLNRTMQFFADEDGWKEDRRLADAWRIYSEFIEKAAAKSTRRVEVTNYVNEFGFVVRSDLRVRGQSVSEADFLKARETFCRSVEWKILAEQEILKKAKPLGFRQREKTMYLMEYSVKVLTLQKEL
jgi:hypothetical protein